VSPQPKQLRLVVALAGCKGNFGRPIENDERILELTGPKLGEPFGLLTEADQDTASTQCRFRKPLRQSMLAREI
jgi:hypothetical protein